MFIDLCNCVKPRAQPRSAPTPTELMASHRRVWTHLLLRADAAGYLQIRQRKKSFVPRNGIPCHRGGFRPNLNTLTPSVAFCCSSESGKLPVTSSRYLQAGCGLQLKGKPPASKTDCHAECTTSCTPSKGRLVELLAKTTPVNRTQGAFPLNIRRPLRDPVTEPSTQVIPVLTATACAFVSHQIEGL